MSFTCQISGQPSKCLLCTCHHFFNLECFASSRKAKEARQRSGRDFEQVFYALSPTSKHKVQDFVLKDNSLNQNLRQASECKVKGLNESQYFLNSTTIVLDSE